MTRLFTRKMSSKLLQQRLFLFKNILKQNYLKNNSFFPLRKENYFCIFIFDGFVKRKTRKKRLHFYFFILRRLYFLSVNTIKIYIFKSNKTP